MEEISDDANILPAPFLPVGDTTGALVLPNYNSDEVNRIDFDVPETEDYDHGEILKVYFDMKDGPIGFRYYQIDEEHRSFVADNLKNLSVMPPEAVEGLGSDDDSD